MNDELRDMLMGKYLDGEITAGEVRLLESELARDPEAQSRLAALEQLHEAAQQVLAGGMGQVRSAAEVFAAAAEHAASGARRRGWWRMGAKVAVAAAAGFVLGWGIFGILGGGARTTGPRNGPEAVLADRPNITEPAEGTEPAREPLWRTAPRRPAATIYSFSDASGVEWVVETYPQAESSVAPASWGGDL
jgi:hypothetical protein